MGAHGRLDHGRAVLRTGEIDDDGGDVPASGPDLGRGRLQLRSPDIGQGQARAGVGEEPGGGAADPRGRAFPSSARPVPAIAAARDYRVAAIPCRPPFSLEGPRLPANEEGR
jgi:hypothetical protein